MKKIAQLTLMITLMSVTATYPMGWYDKAKDWYNNWQQEKKQERILRANFDTIKKSLAAAIREAGTKPLDLYIDAPEKNAQFINSFERGFELQRIANDLRTGRKSLSSILENETTGPLVKQIINNDDYMNMIHKSIPDMTENSFYSKLIKIENSPSQKIKRMTKTWLQPKNQ